MWRVLGVLVILIALGSVATAWFYWTWIVDFVDKQANRLDAFNNLYGILAGLGAFSLLLFGVARKLMFPPPPPPPPVVSTNDAHGNVAVVKLVRTDADALAAYRSMLAERCGDVPLSGMDREADNAASPNQGVRQRFLHFWAIRMWFYDWNWPTGSDINVTNSFPGRPAS